MRSLNYIFIACICLNSWRCKKTEVGQTLSYTTQIYTPPAYNANLYHYAKKICGPFSLRDIVVDSLDKIQAYVIGDFNDGSVFNVANAKGIVKFNSSTNSFSGYPVGISGTCSVRSFFQSSNGLQYIGGYFNNGISDCNFGFKQVSNASITPIAGLNGGVNAIREMGNDIYFTGEFDQYNTSFCSPILFCDKTNQTPVNQLASYTGNNFAYRLEYFQNKWYFIWQNNPYIFFSTSSVTSSNHFNGDVYDILTANGKLYACGEMDGYASGSSTLSSVIEYNGTWTVTGSKSSYYIHDIEYHNGILYASSIAHVFYLDTATNSWKDATQGLEGSFSNIKLIRFIADKLYLYDYDQGLYELSK